MLAAVITCSDRAVSGAYSDRSGPLLREALSGLGFETRDPRVVPDNLVMIRAAIREAVASGSRVVLTTGGTGVGPRDVTVEATLDLLACELPGIMEAIRRHGAEKTPAPSCRGAWRGWWSAPGPARSSSMRPAPRAAPPTPSRSPARCCSTSSNSSTAPITEQGNLVKSVEPGRDVNLPETG